MDSGILTAIFTGLTALASGAAAWGVTYPFYRNSKSPEVAYAYDVDLSRVHIPDSPFGVRTVEPEKKRFVLRITNPRLTPLVVQGVYFQAKHGPRGDRAFVHYGSSLVLDAGQTTHLYLKMEPDLCPDRTRVFLVIEAVGWSKRIDDLKVRDGDLRLRPIPEFGEGSTS